MGDVLVVENLTVAFGQFPAVKSLSFEVEEGEILGMIGPNGAGKTTVLNALTGMVQPRSGRIFFQGRDITSLSVSERCRLGIGRTYQIPRPFVNMNVLENVLVGGVHGASLREKQAREKAHAILHFTGLWEKRALSAGRLDLLDRKRLELARALATNPSVLLLDEVAGGLTEGEVAGLLEIVRGVRASGVTIVWIEHILMTMIEGADRLLCLAAGQRLLCGEPKAVLGAPEVQEVYLGAEEG